MDLTVVVPTRNRPVLLGRMLQSLEKAQPPDLRWEVVVVDNNSDPRQRELNLEVVGSAKLCLRHFLELVPGQSAALNRGIGESRGNVVAFLDDDITVHEDYLVGIQETIGTFSSNVFGGRVLPAWLNPPPDWVTGGQPLRTSRGPIVVHDYGDRPCPYDDEMRLPVGCNFFCRRRLFERYGLFDVRLGPGARRGILGGGETDLLRRFRAAGETIVYSPLVVVNHPVVPERMTKRYFRYRFFCAGRSVPYLATQLFPSVFGVPRYLCRLLGATAGRGLLALASGQSRRAFDLQLEVCEVLGAMYEYRRVWRGRVDH